MAKLRIHSQWLLALSMLCCGALIAKAQTPSNIDTLAVKGRTSSSLQSMGSSAAGNLSGLVSISVTPVNPTLSVGSQQQFTATGTLENGTQANITDTVDWSSSDPTEAELISPGRVKAIAGGTPTITASYGSVSGSSLVTLTDPLGTATGTSLTCPAGDLSGVCYAIAISCPKVDDFTGWIKVTYPTGTPVGTVVFSSGGNGTGFYENNYTYGTTVLDTINQAGLTVVQISWERPFTLKQPYGWQTGPGGMRAVACRYATLAQWVYTNIHEANTAAPFCATGNSAGAEEIGLAMAHYGLGSIFAMVEPTSGPVYGQQVWACDDSEPDAINPCGTLTQYGVGVGGAEQFIDPAYPEPICSMTYRTHETTYDAVFLHDSVVSTDAVLSYPNTFVNFRLGDLDMGAGPNQAATWESAITSSKAISCIAGAPHSIPNTLVGAQAIASDVVSLCKLPTTK
ncbi:MAG: Ig-like domain-containing protein [Candidatus Sulfotelmatobacter sp.]